MREGRGSHRGRRDVRPLVVRRAPLLRVELGGLPVRLRERQVRVLGRIPR